MCYLRPDDLEIMLKNQNISQRRIYIFIDRAESVSMEANKRVLEVATLYARDFDIKIRFAERNYGVAAAVPEAVEWISSYEDKFIVLEDDCHLNESGFEFLEKNISQLDENVSLICATSPWDIEATPNKMKVSSLSKYPLISGWATSASSWREISKLIGEKPSWRLLTKAVARRPLDTLAISFFWAAQIRVNRNTAKAWDCSLALAMLLFSKKSIIPNVTMVTNTGRDKVAAHTLPKGNEDRIFRLESSERPSYKIDYGNAAQRATDRQIENKLYGLKKRHIFSPIKSLLVK